MFDLPIWTSSSSHTFEAPNSATQTLGRSALSHSKRVNGYSSKQDRHFSTDAQRPGYGYTGAFRAPTGV